MEITEVKIFPVRDKKLRAFVSIVLDGSFIVNDIKVISGKEGLFISMPSRRRKNGRFKDIAHPLNNETRQVMEGRIIAEYERVIEGDEDAPRADATEQPEPAAQSDVENREPAAPAPAAAESPEPEPGDKSLDEVAEAHLSDSYWTT